METTSNKNETVNVQQTEGLTGQVNSQAQAVKDIVGEAVNQPTDDEQAKEERMALLEQMRITSQSEVEPEAYSLTVDGKGFFALSDIHGLKGKQKSGKSAVLKVCAAALLSGQQFRVKSELEQPLILFLDTEQQAADVKLIIDEVKYMTQCTDEYIDSHMLLYTLRRLNYDTLIGDTRLLIEHHHPQVVFIDGLVDYVSSFNDEVLSRQLIHDLLLLCEDHRCAIVNVLHENKASDDENMRGHLGTVLAQKAGSVLQCFRSKQGIIGVTCPDSRHGAMPDWHIQFDEEGHICCADERWLEEQQKRSMDKTERNLAKRLERERQRLDTALSIIRENGGYVDRKTLKETLMQRLGVGDSTVQNFIKENLGYRLSEVNGQIQDSENIVLPF